MPLLCSLRPCSVECPLRLLVSAVGSIGAILGSTMWSQSLRVCLQVHRSAAARTAVEEAGPVSTRATALASAYENDVGERCSPAFRVLIYWLLISSLLCVSGHSDRFLAALVLPSPSPLLKPGYVARVFPPLHAHLSCFLHLCTGMARINLGSITGMCLLTQKQSLCPVPILRRKMRPRR